MNSIGVIICIVSGLGLTVSVLGLWIKLIKEKDWWGVAFVGFLLLGIIGCVISLIGGTK